jgi:dsRNA-specific ribonuclease
VSSVLALGQLKPEYIELLTGDESMRVYSASFTSPAFNPEHNYDAYEFLGDATLNKIIVWHLARRFPQLMNVENVKTLARLKINLISKVSFARFGRELGIDKYITCTEDEWVKSQTKLVEDTLEAFIGAIESQIDSRIKLGAGYAICYGIIGPILDRIDISLEYEDLYDAITRLKEVFDTYQRIIGKVEYVTKQDPDTKLFVSEVFSKLEAHERGRNVPDNVANEIVSLLHSRNLVPTSGIDVSRVKNFLSDITSKTDFSYSSISQGKGKSSKAAEIDAAEKAIAHLAKRGFIRVREQTDFTAQLPKGVAVKTDAKETARGQYFQTKVSHNGRTGVGVGFTADESLGRAAYSFVKL